MVGGVEDQKARCVESRRQEVLQAFKQRLCRRQKGVLRVREAQVLLGDPQIAHGTGGLHQGPFREGTAYPVQVEDQLPADGLCVQFRFSDNDHRGKTAGVVTGTYAAQQSDIFFVRPIAIDRDREEKAAAVRDLGQLEALQQALHPGG